MQTMVIMASAMTSNGKIAAPWRHFPGWLGSYSAAGHGTGCERVRRGPATEARNRPDPFP